MPAAANAIPATDAMTARCARRYASNSGRSSPKTPTKPAASHLEPPGPDHGAVAIDRQVRKQPMDATKRATQTGRSVRRVMTPD